MSEVIAAGWHARPLLSPDEDPDQLHTRIEAGSLIAEGDIDLFQAPHFRKVAEDYLRDAVEPRLDLRGVDFIDSAGLAVLLQLARQATRFGKSLRVAAAGGPLRVIRITGIDSVLTLE